MERSALWGARVFHAYTSSQPVPSGFRTCAHELVHAPVSAFHCCSRILVVEDLFIEPLNLSRCCSGVTSLETVRFSTSLNLPALRISFLSLSLSPMTTSTRIYFPRGHIRCTFFAMRLKCPRVTIFGYCCRSVYSRTLEACGVQ